MKNKLFLSFLAICLMTVLTCQSVFGAVVLKAGSQGDEVKQMQQQLKELGYLAGSVDGIFGSGTLSAVRSFQSKVGLTVDGIAGTATLNKLREMVSRAASDSTSSRSGSGTEAITRTLRRGDRGSDVKLLQTYLNKVGFAAGTPDGVFGPGTEGAVRKFQSSKGLLADGIAGRQTVAALLKAQSDSTAGAGSGGSQTLKKAVAAVAVLNVRKGPGTSYPKVGSITMNTAVNVLEQISGDWCKIEWGTGIAYTAVRYLNFDSSSTEPESPVPSEEGDAGSPAQEETPAGRGDDTRPPFQVWKPAAGKINLVWDYNPSTMSVDIDGLNVISPVWFWVNKKDGQLTVTNSRANKAYVDAAHQRGYQVWATVQSTTPEYSKMVVTDPAVGNHVILKLMEAVSTYGLDGINIDFENMDPKDKYLYTAFVERAVINLHSVGATVSVDIIKKTGSTTNWWSSCYDRPGLSSAADYIILMSYDQHGRTSAVNGPVASIGWVENAVQTTLTEVPKEKLIMGVPLYAYDWMAVPKGPDADINNPGDYSRPSSARAMTMDELKALDKEGTALLRSGEILTVAQWITEPTWSKEDGTMYMKFTDTEGTVHEIWYEHPVSILLKLNLIEDYGLAGAASWQYIFANEDIWKVFKIKLTQ